MSTASMEGATSDQRYSPRYEIGRRAWCLGDDVILGLRIGNASRGGLFLETQAPLEIGARARVVVEIDEEAALVAEAEVVWKRMGRGSGMGVRLVKIEEGVSEYLKLLAVETARTNLPA